MTDSTNYNVVSEKNILSEDFYYEDIYRACRQKVCDMIVEELLMADTNERQELNPFLAGKGVYVSQKAIYQFILDPKLREENTGTEFFTVPVFSEDNEIYEWTTKVNFDIEVEGDPYHAMPYEDMAFSYNELTDESNLVWMEF